MIPAGYNLKGPEWTYLGPHKSYRDGCVVKLGREAGPALRPQSGVLKAIYKWANFAVGVASQPIEHEQSQTFLRCIPIAAEGCAM